MTTQLQKKKTNHETKQTTVHIMQLKEQKTEQHDSYENTGMISSAPSCKAMSPPYVTPVVLLM